MCILMYQIKYTLKISMCLRWLWDQLLWKSICWMNNEWSGASIFTWSCNKWQKAVELIKKLKLTFVQNQKIMIGEGKKTKDASSWSWDIFVSAFSHIFDIKQTQNRTEQQVLSISLQTPCKCFHGQQFYSVVNSWWTQVQLFRRNPSWCQMKSIFAQKVKLLLWLHN